MSFFPPATTDTRMLDNSNRLFNRLRFLIFTQAHKTCVVLPTQPYTQLCCLGEDHGASKLCKMAASRLDRTMSGP